MLAKETYIPTYIAKETYIPTYIAKQPYLQCWRFVKDARPSDLKNCNCPRVYEYEGCTVHYGVH